MELQIRVIGTGGLRTVAADELLALCTWLLGEDGFRGRAHLLQREARPGTLGSVPEAVSVGLSSGLPVSALVGAVAVWLQSRTGKLTLKISRSDGVEVKVSADGLRGLKAGELAGHVAQLARALEEGGGEGGSEETH